MRIRELRESIGMGQTQLAEAAGVSQAAIAKWETGVAYPRADKLPTIAKALGCRIDDLYGRESPGADAAS